MPITEYDVEDGKAFGIAARLWKIARKQGERWIVCVEVRYGRVFIVLPGSTPKPLLSVAMLNLGQPGMRALDKLGATVARPGDEQWSKLDNLLFGGPRS